MYSEAKRKSYEAISLLLVKPASLLNCTFKIAPCLCLPEQFKEVISSISASQISRLLTLSNILAYTLDYNSSAASLTAS